MSIIEDLKWRYATKHYDTTHKISNQKIELLKEAINLTASSYGFQPYKVFIISDPLIREQLSDASWGQRQVTEASHLFLFCNMLNISNKEIDAFFKLRAKINNLDINESSEYSNMVKAQMASMAPEQMSVWTSKQTYIALGTLMIACAEFKIDSSPMEGFDNKKYDQILGLKELGLTSSVMLAVGYRDLNDPFLVFRKVRKPPNEVFVNI
ncbi:MAG: NAD(P)H-dependent oxidoreductase [Bacteroidales bacterium]